jgi:hypothetical protein
MSSCATFVESFHAHPNAWLASPRRIWGFQLTALVMALAFAGMALALPGETATERALGAAVFTLVFSGPCLLFAWRIRRAGLWMGPDGVVIRGPLRTWRIPSTEIVAFVPGVQPSVGNGTPCPLLTRVDSLPVGIWALGREGWVWSFDDYLEELASLCDRLNALLDELYPSHPLPAFQAAPAQLR